MSKLITYGIVLVFAGMVLLFVGSFLTAMSGTKEKPQVRTAGGVFIGPFPLFGWASDKKMFYTLMVVMVVLALVYVLMRRL